MKSSYKLKKVKNCYPYCTSEDTQALGLRTNKCPRQDLDPKFSDSKAQAFYFLYKASLSSLLCVTWGPLQNMQEGANAGHVRFPSIPICWAQTASICSLTSSLVNEACLKPEETFWEVYGSCNGQSCVCPKLNKVKG